MLSGIFYCDIQFFRFYHDGVFLDCLIKMKEPTLLQPEQLRSGALQREKLLPGVFQGNYVFKGKRIVFSTRCHFGRDFTIEYEGEYRQDCLVLNSLDHNTGRKTVGAIFTRLV